MKKAIFYLLGILAVSCNKKEPTAQSDLPFFFFDQIDYYHKTISDDTINAIIQKQNKSRKEQGLLQIIKGKVPVSTLDTLFINNMEILAFEKETLPKNLNTKISHLFSLRTVEKPNYPACEKVYRTILVFRNKNKVIGIAKISSDCGLNSIVGARYDANQFGQSGEYKELQEILSKLKKQTH